MQRTLYVIVLCTMIVFSVSVPARPQIMFPETLTVLPGVQNISPPSMMVNFPTFPAVSGLPKPNTGNGVVLPSKGSNQQGINFPTNNAASSNDVIGDNLDCPFRDGLVLYKGGCARLLSDSACEENHWLILNKKGQPECVIRPCPLGELPYRGGCVNVADDSVCGVSEILYVEFNGKPHCDCIPNFIYDNTSTTCVAEHRQGFCPAGMVIEVKGEEVICVKNYCSTDEQVYNVKDGQCYKKTFAGTCSDRGFMLTFEKSDQTATCATTLTRNILEVPTLRSCPPGSKRDYHNECQKIFRAGSNSASYYRVPSAQILRHTCPSSYVRLPNNVCKKTSNIFGG